MRSGNVLLRIGGGHRKRLVGHQVRKEKQDTQEIPKEHEKLEKNKIPSHRQKKSWKRGGVKRRV